MLGQLTGWPKDLGVWDQARRPERPAIDFDSLDGTGYGLKQALAGGGVRCAA
jgi:hypothetical protein